ncbi:hypothetical protein ALC57_17836, partial [Trachymyrmex cornetzi]
EEQLHSGGNCIEKLSYISKFTHNKFTGRSLSNEGVKKVRNNIIKLQSLIHNQLSSTKVAVI